VSTGSTAQWVVEAQAAIQRGAASARADPKEPVAQGEATEVAMEQAEEEEPMPCEAEAHESDEVEAPSVAEVTEALRTSKAKATEAEALRALEAEVAGVGAPWAAEVKAAEASLGMVEPVGQDAEMGVGQASVHPRSKTRRRRRRAPGKRRSIQSPLTILPRGRRWQMPRWPAPRSSQL